PALQRIVTGVDLRQGRQIVAAASVGVPQKDLHILGNIIAAVARGGGEGEGVQIRDGDILQLADVLQLLVLIDESGAAGLGGIDDAAVYGILFAVLVVFIGTGYAGAAGTGLRRGL